MWPPQLLHVWDKGRRGQLVGRVHGQTRRDGFQSWEGDPLCFLPPGEGTTGVHTWR